jgi:dTMP kinase
MSARFIALDGPDGAGKDDQTNYLQQALEAAGISCVQVHETKGTPDGTALYDMLTKGDSSRWSGFAEACLWSAARNKTNLDVVAPALEQGTWVLSNRTPLTTIAYQAYGHGLDVDLCRSLQRFAAPHWPDIFLILDVSPETGLARKSKQKGEANLDRFEREGLELQRKVRPGFLQEAENLGDLAVVVDAEQSIAEVHHAILEVVNQRFGLSLQPVL